MSQPPDQKCNSCLYYKPLTTDHGTPIGQCLRNPPTGNWPYNHFPIVKEAEWCGEFVKK